MRFHIVDVFAEAKYAGNPLAVVFGTPEASRMQAIAREINFSETTFVGERREDGAWPVRIFTPGSELPFAGHPTIGTAAVLRREQDPGARQIVLEVPLGRVTIDFGDDDVGWLTPPEPTIGAELEGALYARSVGLAPEDLHPDLPVQTGEVGVGFAMLPVRSLDAVRRARPGADAETLATLSASPGPDECLVFCIEAAETGNHLHARMFAPTLGIPEDPATGAANVILAAYLRHHDRFAHPELRVEQGYEMGRPSLLRLRIAPSLQVGGRVIAVATGELV